MVGDFRKIQDVNVYDMYQHNKHITHPKMKKALEKVMEKSSAEIESAEIEIDLDHFLDKDEKKNVFVKVANVFLKVAETALVNLKKAFSGSYKKKFNAAALKVAAAYKHEVDVYNTKINTKINKIKVINEIKINRGIEGGKNFEQKKEELSSKIEKYLINVKEIRDKLYRNNKELEACKGTIDKNKEEKIAKEVEVKEVKEVRETQERIETLIELRVALENYLNNEKTLPYNRGQRRSELSEKILELDPNFKIFEKEGKRFSQKENTKGKYSLTKDQVFITNTILEFKSEIETSEKELKKKASEKEIGDELSLLVQELKVLDQDLKVLDQNLKVLEENNNQFTSQLKGKETALSQYEELLKVLPTKKDFIEAGSIEEYRRAYFASKAEESKPKEVATKSTEAEEVKEAEAKPKTPYAQMLSDIKTNTNDDMHAVWKTFFNRFFSPKPGQPQCWNLKGIELVPSTDNRAIDLSVITSWTKGGDGVYTMKLSKPLRMWVTSTDDKGKKDPENGVIMMLGANSAKEVKIKFETKQEDGKQIKVMKFLKGYDVCVDEKTVTKEKTFVEVSSLTWRNTNDIAFVAGVNKNVFNWFTWPFVKIAIGLRGGEVVKETVDGKTVERAVVPRKKSRENLTTNWGKNGEVIHFDGTNDLKKDFDVLYTLLKRK